LTIRFKTNIANENEKNLMRNFSATCGTIIEKMVTVNKFTLKNLTRFSWWGHWPASDILFGIL